MDSVFTKDEPTLAQSQMTFQVFKAGGHDISCSLNQPNASRTGV